MLGEQAVGRDAVGQPEPDEEGAFRLQFDSCKRGERAVAATLISRATLLD